MVVKPEVDIGTDDSGPASLTEQNQLEPVKSIYGERYRPRVAIMSMHSWHAFDHYGQMVVYTHVNGVVPGQPAPAAARRH